MQDDAPIAAFITAPFQHECSVVGYRPGRRALLLEQPCEVADGVVVEPVLFEPVHHGGMQMGRGNVIRGIRGGCQCLTELTGKASLDEAEPVVASAFVAVPERQPRGAARRGHHDHAVSGDLLYLPGGCAQGDDVSDA